MFLKNPDKYANVDLVDSGKCVVCRIEKNQDVAGKPEFAVVHKNLRYWFPEKEQRAMFLQNPEKYEKK